jgi:hypothetical protein
MGRARVGLGLGLGLLVGCGTAVGPDPSPALDGVQDALTTAERGLLGTDARLWRTSGSLARCGQWAKGEDFSSGRYNVHRFEIGVPAGGVLELSLSRVAGALQPALLLATREGVWALDPAGGGAVAGVSARRTVGGRGNTQEVVTVESARDLRLDVYVTGWATVDARYAPSLGRDVKYQLDVRHRCPVDVPAGPWEAAHDGLGQGGGSIPRAGLANPTLQGALGVAVEPYGTVVAVRGKELVSGTVSHFGGPRDTGVSATETGAISGEVLRRLNNPLDPDAATLAARPADYYYVAMRFDYTNVGRSFWQGARILVVAPETGRAVVVRPVDWGPNTRTGRIIDLSPQAVKDLGVDTDATVLVAFAAAGTPLGVVQGNLPPVEEPPPTEEPPVEEPPVEEPPPTEVPDACPAGAVCPAALPFEHRASTRASTVDRFDRYSCAPDTNESGPEVVYRVDVPVQGLLTVALTSTPNDVDVDVHILSDLDPTACLDRGHERSARLVAPGRYWVVVDSWVGRDGTVYAGEYGVRLNLITADTFVGQGLSATAAGPALRAFDVAWQERQTDRLQYAVIDFSRRSTLERLWVLDLSTGTVQFKLHASHGRESGNPSDLAVSDRFSNQEGSNRSSLGLTKTAETYSGTHGYSLRLDGLEPGYNDNVRARAIVFHGASYARAEVAASQGYLGRSLGCPAVDDRVSARLIDAIAGGTLVFSWYPDGDWSRSSRYLR